MTQTTARPVRTGDTIAADTVGTTRIELVAGVDSITLLVMSGAHRHDAWCHTYPRTTGGLRTAASEASRIRALLIQHGTINAIEQATDDLTRELHTAEHRQARSYRSRTTEEIYTLLDQMETPADRALIAQLRDDLNNDEASAEDEPTETPTTRMTDFQTSVVLHALITNHGVVHRGRGTGRASITTIRALTRAGYTNPTIDEHGTIVGATITSQGAARATMQLANGIPQVMWT